MVEDSGSIVVSDENTGYKSKPLYNYPIDWSAIKNKTTKQCANIGEAVVVNGMYGLVTIGICYWSVNSSGTTGDLTYEYFYNGTWNGFNLTGGNKFTPFEWVTK